MNNKKEIAQNKLKLGQARRYLWQLRNKDIEEFEFIDGIELLENRKVEVIKAQIKGLVDSLENKRAGTDEYERGYARGLQDLSELIEQQLNNIEPIEPKEVEI